MKLFKISFLCLCSFLYSLAYSDVQSHFNKIKRDPNALYSFFNSFEKYLSIISNHRPFLLADIIQRAAQQQEHYLEVMDLPDQGASISFGKLIEKTPSFAEKRQLLLANKEFQQNIVHTANES